MNQLAGTKKDNSELQSFGLGAATWTCTRVGHDVLLLVIAPEFYSVYKIKLSDAKYITISL